ncbi:probable inactive purple acid phosphatase 1 isoform X2 [Populus nigra]|uniref:probable inactive purple acid phosphatase 1 isoform X2 n=1 Tax=Populus nigra TaxID=3691 RepID=UPI002B26DDBB|nr:probable inactive purple acid phosphatase 1 isoform X2 [Populus nigra]
MFYYTLTSKLALFYRYWVPMMRGLGLVFFAFFLVLATLLQVTTSHGEQPLSRIVVQNTELHLSENAYVKASPSILGLKGQNFEWVTLEYASPNPLIDDWIGVFSPADFSAYFLSISSASTCTPDDGSKLAPPFLCTAPIKYQYANYSSPGYRKTGKGSLRLQLINQRSDFSFVLFSGGLSNPKLMAVSNKVAFTNPNAPVYPRLAQGKIWNEMTVTWTSGYGINEAEPFVEWGRKDGDRMHSLAGTLTFDRNSLCGAPARTVGWRDPGFIHTSFLKELWPNAVYTYKLGHKLFNGTYVWSQEYQFRASPYPGQSSVQRVVIFGDMGKDEADGSNEYNNYQRGSLNTTKQLIQDLKNIDIVFHIGDICYANGYLSQWDQFTAQVEPIASTVPYMVASGNHERDWPGTGSFYGNSDSGGECGVLAETMFYVPAENRANFWYSTDYGMFRFCIADTEHDWREGTEQYKFIEHCLASVDRQKQPWLIFLAHRVLGYSSSTFYADEGSFEEPMGRESLQKLWQKYKVDIAIYGHAHNYERTCPIYQNICTSKEKSYYKGALNGTIHVVAGGGGASLADFTPINTTWSYFKDHDYGFVKLTAFDHSNLLLEYKKSRDGKVYDSFKISRGYRDITVCTVDSCPSMTLAS